MATSPNPRSLLVVLLLTCSAGSKAQQVAGPLTGAPQCPVSFAVPARPAPDLRPEKGDIHVNADRIDLVEEGASRLQGNVELAQNTWQARADEVFYNQSENAADLSGEVKFWEESVFLAGESAHLEFDDDTGKFTEAEYYLADSQGRGRARQMFVDPGEVTTGKDMEYTTCGAAGGDWGFEGNFWKISAGELRLNHVAERGSGRNIVLKIKDIPVFYSPYFTFPLNRKRKSGLLTPGIGRSGHGGLETRLPLYWNIAPNMDATITPRALVDSGFMGMFEYRYLFPNARGKLNLEYLPGDNEFNDRDRSRIGFEHSQRFLDRGELSVMYHRVSDPEYLEDFGNQLAVAGTRYLPRRADLSYRGKRWNLSARVHGYQVVDRSIAVTSRPYKNLPQVRLDYSPLSGYNKLNLRLTSEFAYFERSDEAGLVTNVTGWRTDLYPALSYPMRGRAAFLTPKIGVRYTQYQLSRQGPFSESPSRALPVASLDGGVFLERFTRLGREDYLHTLEPRLYYLYIPYEDQSDLPVFDSSIFNLDYNALFRENRFSGLDRVGDANQITLALGSQLINRATGKQAGFVRIAQSFFLEDQDVIRQRTDALGELVDNGMPNENLLSPVIIEAGANLIDDWSVRAELYLDPNDGVTRKMLFQAQYNPAGSKVINLAYRVRRADSGLVRRAPTDIEQSDLSFSWPVSGRWNAVGRWNYAVSEGRSLDLFAGVEYGGCCFAVRAVGRRFLTNLDGDFNTGVFLQFQLKGLGGIGRAADFLSQTIPGYGEALQ